MNFVDHSQRIKASNEEQKLKGYLDNLGYEYDAKDVHKRHRRPATSATAKKPQISKKTQKSQTLLNSQFEELMLLEWKFNTSQADMESKMKITNPLRELGGYPSPTTEHFNGYPNQRPYYKTPLMGLRKNPSYCDIIDLKNLFSPEMLYNNMTFLADYIPKSKLWFAGA